MRLYELPRGSGCQIEGEGPVYRLETLDGMYSRCFDEAGNLYHWSAVTPVKPAAPNNFPQPA